MNSSFARTFSACFISMATGLLPMTCDASVVVDQWFVPPESMVYLDTQIGIAPFAEGAQTFTPFVSGQLEGFDFWIEAIGSGTLTTDLLVKVETTTAQGAPSGIILGKVTLPSSFLSQQSGMYKHIAMEGQNIFLQAGERYAAVFQAVPFISDSTAAYDFRGYSRPLPGCQFAYSYDYGQGMFTEDGRMWQDYDSAEFDYVFRTYMMVSVLGPATLNYQITCDYLVLSWSQGVLQSSSQLDGIYTDIISATSPYYVPFAWSGSQQFYRLRIPSPLQ